MLDNLRNQGGSDATATTRKPRVDANELVDPMSRVQVHDATGVVTAGGSGGYAEPTGNDPVLANPEQEPEPLDEPQPKKTRRASRAHRAGRDDDDDDEDSYSPVGPGTGGYGNGGNGGGDDDDYDDSDPDADSVADSQGVPEAPEQCSPGKADPAEPFQATSGPARFLLGEYRWNIWSPTCLYHQRRSNRPK